MRELRACRQAEAAKPEHKAAEPAAPEHEPPKRDKPEHGTPELETLRGWKVVALRSYVRKLPDFPMTPNEIRYANKARLLELLAAYLKK